MQILFLHGWQSVVGGRKPTYLAEHGHEVLNPALPDDDFAASVAVAQRTLDQHTPAVIVGSSRGGAVAMNLNTGEIPLVLLCPAWKHWGQASNVKPACVILHARGDEVIPYDDSVELIANSGLSPDQLIETGTEHRLADTASLAAMLAECDRAIQP